MAVSGKVVTVTIVVVVLGLAAVYASYTAGNRAGFDEGYDKGRNNAIAGFVGGELQLFSDISGKLAGVAKNKADKLAGQAVSRSFDAMAGIFYSVNKTQGLQDKKEQLCNDSAKLVFQINPRISSLHKEICDRLQALVPILGLGVSPIASPIDLWEQIIRDMIELDNVIVNDP